ncbi:MAG: transposase [Thermoguttaceae bacterium]
MSEFRRYFVPGGTYFFTLVTAGRAPLFESAAARALLGKSMRETCDEHRFTTVAIVLLPEHLHAIWMLPLGDQEYPARWKAIKARFTSEWLRAGGCEGPLTDGYRRQRRRGVWQPRYMEHTIRDEGDLEAHLHYLHYNPVKHGYTRRPRDWAWSSFARYVASGDYPEDWGADERRPPDFGDVDADLLE